MTFTGKILVFAILVFCTVCMGLALAVYMAQNNWPEEWAKVQDTNQNLQAKLKDATAAKDQLDAQLQQTQADKQQSETALNTKITALQSEKNDLLGRESELRTQLAGFQQDANDSLQEALFRRDEVIALREKLELAKTERDQSFDDRVAAENARNVAQQQLEAADARNKSLMERVGQLRNLALSLGANPDQPVSPAPPVVEGYVRNTTADSELVEISIGSDDGLRPKHQLDVYRVGNVPQRARFVGRIEVTEVQPDRAIAKFLSPRRGKIQKGDHVTSKLQ
jgi:hypothetical protein